MKFEDYLKIHDCKLLKQTEQSSTFLINTDKGKRVCKKYPSELERCKEELAYHYIQDHNLLNTPSLTLIGCDFIEMEFIQRFGEVGLLEIISGVRKLYLNTLNNPNSNKYFPNLDLSQSKIERRLEYLPIEMNKRNMKINSLLRKCNDFLKNNYVCPDQYCLVHGDLKSPHVIKSVNGVCYIDLSLLSIANPWYDLAFLYMEKRGKSGLIEEIVKISQGVFGREMKINKGEAVSYLRSSIFYRSLYDVIFALRHRPEKTLHRTIGDLTEIVTR